MLRPCFLVVDREAPGAISTRKLVIETAKFNVITAYSGAEALEALEKLPRVDGVVLDPGIRDMPCAELIQQIKTALPKMRIVAVGRHDCEGADYKLETFEPKQLLTLLQQIEPERTALIQEHDDEMYENNAEPA